MVSINRQNKMDSRDQVIKSLVINLFSDFHIKHLAQARHRVLGPDHWLIEWLQIIGE